MGRKSKICLAAVVIVVLAACMLLGGSMMQKYETNRYEINESFQNILAITDMAEVVFAPSEDEKTTVVCYERKNMKHTVKAQNDTLTIKIVDTRKWYEHIGIFWGTSKITVYLPAAEYGALSVKASTGNIHMKNLIAEDLDISVSTGNITVSNVTCQANANIKVSTGKTTLTQLTCKNLTSGGSTGDIILADVIAAEKLSVKRSTGNVKFDGSDAGEIFVETNTGNVTGTLLSEKIFLVQTDTGKVSVPQTVSGGKCEINTDTGNIKLALK